MAEMRNRKKLAAIHKDSPEEHHRNNLSRYTIAPRINEEYSTRVTEKTECRETKDFCGVEIWILVALSELDEFLLNSQVHVQSRTY